MNNKKDNGADVSGRGVTGSTGDCGSPGAGSNPAVHPISAEEAIKEVARLSTGCGNILSTSEALTAFLDGMRHQLELFGNVNFNEYFATIAIAHFLRWQNMTAWQRLVFKIKRFFNKWNS